MVNKNILLFGGMLLQKKKLKVFNILKDFYFINKGCQKNGDSAENIHAILRVNNQSIENQPQWEEYHAHFQHPRTDCGYFQLGKKRILLYT